MHFPRLTTTLHYPPLPGSKLSRFQHIPELLACKKSAYPSPLRCAVHKIGIRASCSNADKEKCPEACKQRSKAHYQHFLLRPRSKNREVLVHRLKGEWEFVWQVKMQNCKGSLEPANANSSNGSVSNQVLFTSHIVLKSDVIPIPSTLTCHRLQREIYSFRKKPIYLAAAFSEPGWRQRACVPFPPHLPSPKEALSGHGENRGEADKSLSLRDEPAARKRLSGIPEQSGSPARERPEEGTYHCSRDPSRCWRCCIPPCRAGAGPEPGGRGAAPGERSGRSRAAPAGLAPAGGGEEGGEGSEPPEGITIPPPSPAGHVQAALLRGWARSRP